MSIRTADCIAYAIANYPPLSGTSEKDWKRRSKKKVGDKIIRTFEVTTIPNLLFEIEEQGGVLTRLMPIVHNKFSAVAPVPLQVLTPAAGGLLDKVRELIEQGIKDADIVRACDLPGVLTFDKLPQVPEDGGGTEDLDFENCELIDLDDDSITVSAGGDWQDPKTFSATFKAGKAYYNGDAVDGFQDGMDNDKMLQIVYPQGIPYDVKKAYED